MKDLIQMNFLLYSIVTFFALMFNPEMCAQNSNSNKLFMRVTIPDMGNELSDIKKSVLNLKKQGYTNTKKNVHIYRCNFFFNDRSATKFYKNKNQNYLILPEIFFRNNKPDSISKLIVESNFILPDEFFELNLLPANHTREISGNDYYIFSGNALDVLEEKLNKILENAGNKDRAKLYLRDLKRDNIEKGFVIEIKGNRNLQKTKKKIKDIENPEEEKKETKSVKYKGIERIIFQFKNEKYFNAFREIKFEVNKEQKIIPEFDECDNRIVFDLLDYKLNEKFRILDVLDDSPFFDSFRLKREDIIHKIKNGEILFDEDYFLNNGIIDVETKKIITLEYLDKLHSYDSKHSFHFNDNKISLYEGYRCEVGQLQKIKAAFENNKLLKRLNFSYEEIKGFDGYKIIINNKTTRLNIADKEFDKAKLYDRIEKVEIFYPDFGDKHLEATLDTKTKTISFPKADKIKYEVVLKAPPPKYEYENISKVNSNDVLRFVKNGELNIKNFVGSVSVDILPRLKLKKVVKMLFFDCNESRNTSQIVSKIEQLKKDFENRKIAGFSLMLAYSEDQLMIVNSWDKNYKKELKRHVSNSKNSKMLLRTLNYPNAIPVQKIMDSIARNSEEIKSREALSLYFLDEEIFITNKTRLGIPPSEKYFLDHFNVKQYNK